MLKAIKETLTSIRNLTEARPEIAIILGTGLGKIADEIEIEIEIPYENIPNFPVSTVEGHAGKLIIGQYAGKKILVLNGRFHYYEGYSMQEVTFPVRVLHFLGIKYLFISNAAGGLNPEQEIGDLMLIDDHINLMPNPLLGKHYPEFGARFPDMSEVYDRAMLARATEIATEQGISLLTGCYIGVTGPTLETPKEYAYLRTIGGDAVGMSTVPEAIVAHQMGLHILAVSVITDLGVPGKIEKITHKLVQEAAEKAAPKLTRLIAEIINRI